MNALLALCVLALSSCVLAELTVDFEFANVAPTCCPVPPPECGDGVCDEREGCDEDRFPCRLDCDCGALCGDEECHPDEDCRTCPGDCGECAVCGNEICESDGDPAEDCLNCNIDCGRCQVCGDGICELDETCNTCSADCGTCPSGVVQGRIVDAVTGAPLAGASATLYLDGVAYGTVTTDAEGYMIYAGVPSPFAVFFIQAEGYYDAWTQIQVLEGFNNRFVRAMSPFLEKGQWRMVLTWLDEPFDLDLTHYGPWDGNAYDNGICNWEYIIKNDSVPFAGYSSGDDVDSLGPESILILHIDPEEQDREFWVHNYSGDRNDPSELLRNSTAVVWAFNHFGQQGEWSIPRNAPLEATWWHVFNLRQGKYIHNVNMYYSDSAANCGYSYCPHRPDRKSVV